MNAFAMTFQHPLLGIIKLSENVLNGHIIRHFDYDLSRRESRSMFLFDSSYVYILIKKILDCGFIRREGNNIIIEYEPNLYIGYNWLHRIYHFKIRLVLKQTKTNYYIITLYPF